MTEATTVGVDAPPSAPPALALEAVTKRYGRVEAVSELSASVTAGEVLAIVGPSGCGKSTTLRLVAGLEPPDRGRISVGGKVVAGDRDWVSAEHRRVGLVFQDHALFPHLDVAANVAFGLHRWAPAARRARVAETLELVGLAALSERYPHELSGGEQQRVALARAIAPEPVAVLLDEPFSNLDRNLRSRVRADTLAVLQRTGATAVLVTHDQEEALAVGDRVLVMRAGRCEQLDEPQRVFHAPATRFVAAFMGDADFLPARREPAGLVTDIGPVPGPAPEGAVDVVLRPHHVTLSPDVDGASRVVGAVYQGAFSVYTVRLPSGHTVRSLQPHTVALAPGDPVRVGLAPGAEPAVLPSE
jgi:iron(III) transport system ATP-binding protein